MVERTRLLCLPLREWKGEFMRIWRVLGSLSLLIAFQGCAGAGLAVMGATAGVGMSTGVEHTLNGVVYKNLHSPARQCSFRGAQDTRSDGHAGEDRREDRNRLGSVCDRRRPDDRD